MKLALVAAGAGAMYCGACARDAGLALGLRRLGWQVDVVPVYTPMKSDYADLRPQGIRMGGISAYLMHKHPVWQRLGPVLEALFDRDSLLRRVSERSVSTDPRELGPLTLAMLAGKAGPMRSAVERFQKKLTAIPSPDVVLISNSMLLGLGEGLEVGGRAVPVVCQLQGEDTFLDALAEPYRTQAWEALRNSAARVSCWISPSASYRDRMSDRLGIATDRIAVVPASLDLAFFSPGPESVRQEQRVGCLSSLLPAKGHDLFVEACRSVLERMDGVRFEMAGRILSRPFAVEVLTTAKRLGDRFHYLGELGPQQKVEWLRSLDLFVFPSRLVESRAMAALEAMACGVPVACFPHNRPALGPESLATSTGAPPSAEPLAELIHSRLSDPEALRASGQRQRAWLEQNHSLETVAACADRVLRSCVA